MSNPKHSTMYRAKWFLHPCVYPFISSIKLYNISQITSFTLTPKQISQYLPSNAIKPLGYVPRANIIYYLSKDENTLSTTSVFKMEDKIPLMVANPLKIKWLHDPTQYDVLYEHHLIANKSKIANDKSIITPYCIGYRLKYSDKYHSKFYFTTYNYAPINKDIDTPITIPELIQEPNDYNIE